MTQQNKMAGLSDDAAINPTGMYSKVILVTTEMAAAWLATMPAGEQRNARMSRVRSYKKAREEGRWVLHHQGIAFDTDGRLRDGQHRLLMIVETGMPTVLYVTFNVPQGAFLHVDEQLPRSIRDAIKMAGGGDYTHSVTSVARVLTSYPRSEPGQVTVKEAVVHTLLAWAEDLSFAEQHTGWVVGLTRGVRALVARAHAYLVGEEKKARLSEWCAVLRTGIPVSKEFNRDTAAITYRNFLLSAGGRQGPQAEVEKYRKGQTALTAFIEGTPMTKCYGTEKDLFPIPADRCERAEEQGEL